MPDPSFRQGSWGEGQGFGLPRIQLQGSQVGVSLSQASKEAMEEAHPSLSQRCGEPQPASE